MERTLALAAVKKVGETVLVSGWVQARRDMGKLVFFDLRDRSGRLQVVGVPAELDAASQEALKSLRPEFVLTLTGVVQARGPQQVNSDEPTGTIELLAKKITILNAAKTPPFELDSEERLANEELRLQYRYLDLRRARLARNLRLRAAVIKNLRDYFFSAGFLEVETPILTKGTPEGSREFLVPARLHPGKFYVLPQSPQQFKQLLMVAGVERYVQIARCFRDEDQRGDRQPEFTQLDYEMSFVTEAEVMQLTEAALLQLLAAVAPEKKILTTPFPRLTYADSLAQYGSDKPDLRVHKDDPNELAFVWIVDMPLFDQSETAGRLVANHHPFTAPKFADRAKLDNAPATVLAEAYDIVLNGFEIGGGSIRIHERELQNKIFEILGLSPTDITERFGHLLEALDYGAPPHGGCAWGLDRLVSILANEPNIREVIAFPKTGDARDPLMGAPSPLPSDALAEAHIKPA